MPPPRPVTAPVPVPVPALVLTPVAVPPPPPGPDPLATPASWQSPPSEPRPRSNRGMVAVAVVLLLAVVIASAVLWRGGLLGGDEPDASAVAAASPSSDASASATVSPPEDDASTPDPAFSDPSPGPYEITGDSLTRFAVASVPSTSPDAFDGAGITTTYEAANMLDGDIETAWRTEGDATGKTITLTLDEPMMVNRVGLVNGYAKTDPATGEDRYAQTRRITAVTWTVGEKSFRQRLDEDDPLITFVDVGPVEAQRIAVRIDAVTEPGDTSFDQTAISEVEILG